MTSVLSDHVFARPRFSRSANVERDHGPRAIEGYIPTGRIVDVIARIGRGLSEPAAGRAFSLTGPHGGGKSSFAVFVDALLSASSSPEHKAAHQILQSVDDGVQHCLATGLKSLGASRKGFTRAFATARAEPVNATVGRALYLAALRDFGEDQQLVPRSFMDGGPAPAIADVTACVKKVCQEKPLVIVIDELGKNLEYFASSTGDGDPFLLQNLAELTQGEGALPLLIMTLQHLSFAEYLQHDSSARRREWAKIQGRFQDIPFVESASEARRLIAASLEPVTPDFHNAASQWFNRNRKTLESLGLRDLLSDVPDALPLHPITLAVLPELCSRYGQNERTLFSFLAGAEPNAIPAVLDRTVWSPGQNLPLIGLDLLYDYFLESSANMIGVTDGASRWIEIETRIRDTAGLKPFELKVLKVVGVLNLVSTGGRLRASKAVLEFALNAEVTELDGSVEATLATLSESGLIVYRSFSDEYRIWQGSNYDLKRVVAAARRECELTELADLLNAAVPLDPVVAGRHSQRTGVLRVFTQKFASSPGAAGDNSDSSVDGTVVYLTTTEPVEIGSLPHKSRPVIVVAPNDLAAVRLAAVEAGALISALATAEKEGADWVARQELVERTVAAQQALGSLIGRTWGAEAGWKLLGARESLDASRGPSAATSDVSDAIYPRTPRVANEMISRRELTSQGAKARRELIEAMLANPTIESFGISGYGPEKAIYEAVFRITGIHRKDSAGCWSLQPPTDRKWQAVWRQISESFDRAVESRTILADIASTLAAPPFGLKNGVIPLLLLAVLLARQDEIALYEHGSLILSIDDAVAERLTKNPGHFSIRNTQVHNETREMVVAAIVERFKISGLADRPSFLHVATALFRELRMLPPYTQKAKRRLSDHAIAVRDAFHTAAEPDVLIFETLPILLGTDAFVGRSRSRKSDVTSFAERLAEAFVELRDAYPALLDEVQERLAEATASGGGLAEMKHQLTAQATSLEGRVLEPRLRSFVGALTRSADDQAWLENVAMVIAEGQAPRVWTDEVAGHFPLKVAELGGAMRRTLALLFDRLASGSDDAFAINRMTLTRPDGSESVELLAITEQQRLAVDRHLKPVLERLVEEAGSRPAALRLLMARLATDLEQSDKAYTKPQELGERRSGNG
jgi:hypothetical protein